MKVQVGDQVVFPRCGVGEIEALVTMPVGGEDVELYQIMLDNDKGRVWVPKDRIADQGLRPVMAAKRVKMVLRILAEQEAPERRRQWNQRQRRYTEMLTSNEPTSLARLVGELAAVRAQKSLSFTEKRMFREAWALLVSELAAAASVTRPEMEARIIKEAELDMELSAA